MICRRVAAAVVSVLPAGARAGPPDVPPVLHQGHRTARAAPRGGRPPPHQPLWGSRSRPAPVTRGDRCFSRTHLAPYYGPLRGTGASRLAHPPLVCGLPSQDPDADRQVVDPLGDRNVGTGTDQDRAHGGGQHADQAVPPPAPRAGFGHPGQHHQQILAGQTLDGHRAGRCVRPATARSVTAAEASCSRPGATRPVITAIGEEEEGDTAPLR
jgi:hypothetical protein